ncbi:mannose-1-phosphate guanylyltransferase/mannose-6-phosphate isomerase [Halofilum ochraceum]|uniref:mannose-1-phosphate guanylyltransferase/mannose-6-phosphate isomerase n=1 Tax=Halofilum ochraceum TaxID=1611323 RepID=UPI000834C422|nr:mannose-1-phosphate guanylyltransferase/mannose-6-phosphate isomerase [Halofilum ochraceum]
MVLPVILAGGNGARLWPLSRQLKPKQFLPLVGKETMLQATLTRLEGLTSRPPIVLCNEQHRFMIAEQLREIDATAAAILLEPLARNTAPAIALAALHATANGEDPLLLVLSADHVIQDTSTFHAQVAAARALAEAGYLVTFGVSPTEPETGYGYIERGVPVGDAGYIIKQFIEKPQREAAERYLGSGVHYWNSGMFLFRASSYIDELGASEPTILSLCREALASGARDLDFLRVAREPFTRCRAISIDHAVMEKTGRAAMVPLDAGWSDIGSWSALAGVSERDAAGNVCNGDVIALDTRDSLIHSDHRLVATLGVEDLVVIETCDAVLIAHKERAQDIRKIVDRLQADGRTEHVDHRQVIRPWGSYDCVDRGDRFQVKRIIVRPGARLSLQMHHHRAEHWVVVRGTARVTSGDDVCLVSENQSTFIPLGQIHALENPGHIPLELIEVQSGSYLGEDDIVRFNDWYGRVASMETASISEETAGVERD